MPFLLGYADVDTSINTIEALAKNGADLIEVGLSFSDPLADGIGCLCRRWMFEHGNSSHYRGKENRKEKWSEIYANTRTQSHHFDN